MMMNSIETSLQNLVEKYKEHAAQNDLVGGMYHGSVKVASFRFGDICVMKNTYIHEGMFARKVIIGIQIGSNWYPRPANASSTFYSERKKVIDEIKKEAHIILSPLQEITPKSLMMWVEGSSYSVYFLGIP